MFKSNTSSSIKEMGVQDQTVPDRTEGMEEDVLDDVLEDEDQNTNHSRYAEFEQRVTLVVFLSFSSSPIPFTGHAFFVMFRFASVILEHSRKMF